MTTSQLNTDLLNQVKNFIVNNANENGIVLADEFDSVDDFKKFIISLTMKTAMEVADLELPEAYDLVMGDGAYTDLADSIWEGLNS